MAAAAHGGGKDLPSKHAQGGEEVDAANREQVVAGPVSVDTDPAGREDLYPKGETAGLLLRCGHAETF